MTEQSQLAVREERSDKAKVLCLTGRLDGTNTAILEAAVAAHLQAEETLLLFDLEQLIYISSAGLRVLLVIARKVQAQGGKALFCSLSDDISQVFAVSGFKDVLSVYRSRADALAAA